ncbi:MAG: DUF1735 domain-containing protein [Bacteroidetes bacterium]|nr:DUF1735 domain-containing protein [Bacteroidota bacterium]
MKYLQITKQALVVLLAAAVFTSCDKKKEVEEVTSGQGRTTIKLVEGGAVEDQVVSVKAIDFIPDPQTLEVIDIRRDAQNSDELNKTVVVTIKDDTSALRIYNDSLVAHGGTPVDAFPGNWYTTDASTPKTGGDGGTYAVTFAPGVFAKQLKITIPNAQLLDPSTTYGLAFTIESVSPETFISYTRSLIITIGAKNIYDGIYQVEGNFIHPVYNGPFGTSSTGGPLEVAMITTGANTCSRLGVAPADIADYDGFIFWLTAANGGPGLTGFSNVFPAYSVDPSTNAVTIYALPGSANSVTWNNYGSTFDPVTHNFTMHYGYNGTRKIDETWTYLRPR